VAGPRDKFDLAATQTNAELKSGKSPHETAQRRYLAQK
jgi:hypothetical protein